MNKNNKLIIAAAGSGKTTYIINSSIGNKDDNILITTYTIANSLEIKKKIIKNASIIGFTVASALIATRGLKIKGKQIFEGIIELPEKNPEGLIETLAENLSSKTKKLVEKVQDDKVLKFGQRKRLLWSFRKDFLRRDGDLANL